MTLVDIRTLVDYLHALHTPQTVLLDQILGHERVILGDLVYYEVMRGFRRDADYQLARSVLEPLERHSLSYRQSVASGIEHFRLLRNQAHCTPSTTTMLLASHCLLEGLPLLFSDAVFAPMVDRLGLVDRLQLPAPELADGQR